MSLDDDSYLWRSPGGGNAPSTTEPSPGVGQDRSAELGARFAEAVDATRPASEGNARRRSTASDAPAAPTQPGSLAAKALSLRILEDDIAAQLSEVECALQALEAERTLEDAGFRSADDFRERVAPQLGLLHEMREPKRRAAQVTGRVRKRAHARPRTGDVRARRTQALTAIEHAMGRFRELGQAMRGKIEQARDILVDIDRAKTFADCGYTSFDEFLELAIGPSPILTKCLTVLGELPPPTEPEPSEASGLGEDELPSFADPPGPIVSDDRPPALFELPQEPVSEEPASDVAASEEGPTKPARQARVQRSAIAVSITLGVISALIGTLAGVRASHASQAAAETDLPAATAAAPAPEGPSAAHRLPAIPPVETKHGPLSQVASQPASPLARRGHDTLDAAALKKDAVPSFH
jgi:hypothetical protein